MLMFRHNYFDIMENSSYQLPPDFTQWWCRCQSIEYKECLIYQDRTELRQFYVLFLEIFGYTAHFFRLCDAKAAITKFLRSYEGSLY